MRLSLKSDLLLFLRAFLLRGSWSGSWRHQLLHSLLHMAWRQMSVAHGHLNRLVPSQLLDGPDVDALHDQPADEGMAQDVPGHFSQLSLLHCRVEPMLVVPETHDAALGNFGL